MKSKTKARQFSGRTYRLATTKTSRGAARKVADRLRSRGSLARVTYDHAPGAVGKVYRVWHRSQR